MSRNAELAEWGPLFVRLALGIPIFLAGVGKVLNVGPKATGIEGFAMMLGGIGFPSPTFFAWLVGVSELVTGALILVGVAVRVSGAVVAVIMLVATAVVHLPQGYPAADGGVELTLALFFVALALVFTGPGKFSVERELLDGELLALPERFSG